MSQVIDKRVTASIEGDFVVFLIGMRVNQALEGLEVAAGVRRDAADAAELEASPESGFLGAGRYVGSPRRPMVVQYWRSFEHLERLRAQQGRRALAGLGRSSTSASGRAATWASGTRPTWCPPASYDSVYNNMPPIGLGAVTELIPAAGRNASAAGRAGIRDEPYPEGAPTENIDV